MDGQSLFQSAISGLKPQELYAAQSPVSHVAVLSDGTNVVAEANRLVRVAPRMPPRAVQFDGLIDAVHARPRRPQLLVVTSGKVVLLDGAGVRKPVPVEAGRNEQFAWTSSGRTFTYLHLPDDPKQLISLRENNPDDGTDKLLAKTSQFASASANTDASVFVGSSRSKASPYVLILLRVTRRELTLCEHRSSDPANVQPFFAPDSQSVFFQSDRHGKPAIYRVRVEKFVEETEPA